MRRRSRYFTQVLFQTVLLTGSLILIAAFRFKLRAGYLVYASAFLAVYLCGSSLEGIARYLSVVFPLFIALGLVTTRFEWAYEPYSQGPSSFSPSARSYPPTGIG